LHHQLLLLPSLAPDYELLPDTEEFSYGGDVQRWGGVCCYGEVLLMPHTTDATHLSHALFRKQIRFLSFSASSDRCSPLLVLHTIGSRVMFKLVPCTQQRQQLASTDATLDIHLVAMPVSQSHLENGEEHACFWGVLVGEEAMYTSCLALLNLRCLAMVLDLDETFNTIQ